MQPVIRGLEKILEGISKVAMAAAALMTLTLAVIGTVDVFTTNILQQAIPGAVEMSKAGLALLVFLGLAVVSRSGDHIKVDILINRLSERGRNICYSIGYFFTALLFFFWTQQLWFLAKKSWSIRETVLGLLQFPLYPIKIAVFLALAVATIETLRRLILSIVQIFQTRPGA